MASGAKNATKPSISFLAKASLAPAFLCLISSRREVAELQDECVPPVDVSREFNVKHSP